jgi:hypothetical protein
MVSFTPWPLYLPKKGPPYPLKRRLDGSQSWSGRRGESRILYLRDSNPKPRPCSPVASRYTDWALQAKCIKILLLCFIGCDTTSVMEPMFHLYPENWGCSVEFCPLCICKHVIRQEQPCIVRHNSHKQWQALTWSIYVYGKPHSHWLTERAYRHL